MIPQLVADYLLQKEIEASIQILIDSNKYYTDISECMLWVLIDMTYCLRNKFIKGFPKFWKNLDEVRKRNKKYSYDNVIKEMKDSLWFSQTGRRSKMLINMIIECEYCKTTCGKYPV